MSEATGLRAKMGIKSVADWGDAYAAVDTLIPFTSENFKAAFDRIEDDTLDGSTSRLPSVQGNLAVPADSQHDLDYNNMDALFLAAFGSEASRVFTISDDDLPIQYWNEFERTVERWRYGPSKVAKLVISGSHGGKIKAAVTWAVKSRARSATAFPSLSFAGTRSLMIFSDMQFRIGDQVDALAAGDALGITEFEFTLDRMLKTDDYDSEGGTEILVPVPNDFRVCGGKIKCARYNATNAQLITWLENDTALQADFIFTKGAEQFKLELPNIRLTTGFDPPAQGPGIIPLEGEFTAHKSLAGNPMYTGNEARVTFV